MYTVHGGRLEDSEMISLSCCTPTGSVGGKCNVSPLCGEIKGEKHKVCVCCTYVI